MPASPPFLAVVGDVLWCLGIGLGLGALRDLAGMVLGSGPVRSFVLDLLAFALAAVGVCGFAAGASSIGVVRWYMAAGMGLGALGWRWGISGALHRAAARALRVLTFPLRVFTARILSPLREKRKQRQKRKSIKKDKKRKMRLQKTGTVLYN